jgi:hypothetical protein
VVLRYSSGGGNGPFGIAWSDGLLFIPAPDGEVEVSNGMAGV